MAISLPYFRADPSVVNQAQLKLAQSQTPEQRAIQQQLQQLPEYQAAMRELAQGYRLGEGPAFGALAAKANALGIGGDESPDILDRGGSVRTKSWMEAHPKLYIALVAGGALGGAAAAPLLAGAAGAGGAGSTTTVMSGGGTAMGTGGTTAAIGGSSPAWMNSNLWRTAVPMAGNLAGTYLDNQGRQQAADTMRDAAERAGKNTQQATQQSVDYARQMQAQTAPWLNPAGVTDVRPPQFQQRQSFAQIMGGQGGNQMVTLRAPSGETRTVPAGEAQRYLDAGAVRVN